ncbi:hypothetical protein, partial [Rhizobium sp. BK456]|uniref:hypothetical protein n=1 Tax=Rhizobium sp. BK456 TaxID=2587007 RepID=UPI001801F18A
MKDIDQLPDAHVSRRSVLLGVTPARLPCPPPSEPPPLIAAISSCPGFWSCQARAAGNGFAVLHFVA